MKGKEFPEKRHKRKKVNVVWQQISTKPVSEYPQNIVCQGQNITYSFLYHIYTLLGLNGHVGPTSMTSRRCLHHPFSQNSSFANNLHVGLITLALLQKICQR